MLDKILNRDIDKREIVEYVTEHPDEFINLTTDAFSGTKPESLALKQRLLEFVDLLNDKLAMEVIVRAIQDLEGTIRVSGLQSAYRRRFDSFNPTVAKILENNDELFEARKWAVHILGSTDPDEYGRLLRMIARNQLVELELRKEAIFTLTNMSNDETIGAICTLLGDPNSEIRQSGAWALSKIGSSQSILCLLAALEDEEEDVRDWAIRGLRDMDDARALQGLADTMKKCDSKEQERMIRLVVEKRSEIILRAIAELLLSSDVGVKRQAAWAMGVSPYPPAAGNLEILLDDDDEQVRTYAKEGLVRLGHVKSTDFDPIL